MRVLIFAIALFLPMSTPLYAQTPFYQGKQIKVVVGFTSGGFYDRWARLLSRYMPKHIPGIPGNDRAEHARSGIGGGH